MNNKAEISEVKIIPIHNQTAVCFNSSKYICSKPRTRDLSHFEKVIYSQDFTPLYGIQRLQNDDDIHRSRIIDKESDSWAFANKR